MSSRSFIRKSNPNPNPNLNPNPNPNPNLNPNLNPSIHAHSFTIKIKYQKKQFELKDGIQEHAALRKWSFTSGGH